MHANLGFIIILKSYNKCTKVRIGIEYLSGSTAHHPNVILYQLELKKL
ncbi:predicted protein [Botrytis cinerea T4]|uniref:Uncharacterized protein n=1 Tax=Botryotinia fuckeliana (strain T4) TaxID=999810 RepID=G2YFF0_BOTF4|nr:predicted protein [Botrytis cinerea T4]